MITDLGEYFIATQQHERGLYWEAYRKKDNKMVDQGSHDSIEQYFHDWVAEHKQMWINLFDLQTKR
jgi:hypothetical protein